MVLAQMFGTPDRINILRKAFQLTSNDERGYLMSASIQNLNLTVDAENDAESIIRTLEFKQEVDRYLKAVLANIHSNVSSLYKEEIDPLQTTKDDLEKDIKEKKEALKELNKKIAEKSVVNDSTVGKNL